MALNTTLIEDLHWDEIDRMLAGSRSELNCLFSRSWSPVFRVMLHVLLDNPNLDKTRLRAEIENPDNLSVFCYIKTPHSGYRQDEDAQLYASALMTHQFIWNRLSARNKFFVIATNWNTSVPHIDFSMNVCYWKSRLDRLKEWTVNDSLSGSYKIQALVSLLDQIAFSKLMSPDELKLRDLFYADYAKLLNDSITAMEPLWEYNQDSILTWRQLQGYPQFFEKICNIHPWLQSLVAIAWIGIDVGGLHMRRFEVDSMAVVTVQACSYTTQNNPTNPLDELLAQAWMGRSCINNSIVDARVEHLYFLLDDCNNPAHVLMLLAGPAEPRIAYELPEMFLSEGML